MRRRYFLSLFPFSLLLAAVFPVAGEVSGKAPGNPPSEASGLVAFETSTLTIGGADGRDHFFTVELALSARQRARGLMFRERLAADAGMLFLYEGEAERAMWMKNTMAPLDLLFFDGDGRIIRIEHGAAPYSRRPISSDGPARGVLELSGGTARRLGIVAGDRIVHPLLPPGAQ